jgi:hypothetical protein
MPSTFTTAKHMELVGRGDQVGVWDTPENSNWSIVDSALGAIATISLNNTPIILNAAQFQCYQITLNSTLTGNVAITFPSTFTGPYVIDNICTGSSAFTVTLQTTVAGGQVIGCPFGESFDIINDGTNIKFRNFGRVGGYWDYAGSSVPAWVTACTVPPYLNCDGTAFSSAIYPRLFVTLGGNILPDSFGRARLALDQGANRITSSNSGFSGNTLLAAGGNELIALSSATLPAVAPAGSVTITSLSAHTRSITGVTGSVPTITNPANDTTGVQDLFASAIATAGSGTFTGTPIGGGAGHQNVQPSYIGGITIIRAG